MTKEEKLQKIYEKIADKTLSMWCIFVDDNSVEYIYDNKLPRWLIRKIIWHPVMINTCIFNIYKYNSWDIKIIQELLNLWDRKLEPIENCWND